MTFRFRLEQPARSTGRETRTGARLWWDRYMRHCCHAQSYPSEGFNCGMAGLACVNSRVHNGCLGTTTTPSPCPPKLSTITNQRPKVEGISLSAQ
jgi:hypothetical protein